MPPDTPKLFAFVRLPEFERSRDGVLSEEDVRKLEMELQANPLAGPMIPGAGGVRKVRASQQGRGKRGGARVIYYVWDERGRIYLLVAYAKSAKSDLTPQDKVSLHKLVDSIREEQP